jgi:hypothetical protein
VLGGRIETRACACWLDKKWRLPEETCPQGRWPERGVQFGSHGERKFSRDRVNQFHRQLAHGLVDAAAGNTLGSSLAVFSTIVLARVVRYHAAGQEDG